MPWQAGTYSKGNNGTGGWTGDASLGIGIEAGRHDTQDNDFATGINQCLNKDGSNSATGNLNLGGFKYTNAGLATARTELARVDQIQDGDFIWLGTTGGTATAQTASASPAITAYKNGQKFRMKPGFSSTGSVFTSHSLNVNSLGAKSIIHQDGQSPTLGSWLTGTGRVLELVYNDGFFVVVNAPQYYQSYTPTVTPQAGTASGLSVAHAVFTRIASTILFNVNLGYTQGVASATYVDVSLPVRPANAGAMVTGTITPAGNTYCAFGLLVVGTPGFARMYDYQQSAILTGAKTITISGHYQIG